MADVKLFPYRSNVPVTLSGELPSVSLVDFLNKVFKVIGGYEATTNYQLLQNLQSLTDAVGLHAFERPQPTPLKVRAGDFVAVAADVSGYTVSVPIGDVVSAVLPFIPRQEQVKQRPVDDAGQIIATRVFRA